MKAKSDGDRCQHYEHMLFTETHLHWLGYYSRTEDVNIHIMLNANIMETLNVWKINGKDSSFCLTEVKAN